MQREGDEENTEFLTRVNANEKTVDSGQQRKPQTHLPREPATRTHAQNVSKSSPMTSKKYSTSSSQQFISGMKDWLHSKKSNNGIHPMNKIKRKNHMVITIDATEVPDKIQPPFLIKHSANLEQKET